MAKAVVTLPVVVYSTFSCLVNVAVVVGQATNGQI